ncbi:MAG TPA: GDP-mannose 4,6-dehydratase [Actinomycetota bacterium]|nr:GDP-mannose 4,6-dehydratase [Actinomycetota bacterium]
MPRALITGIGGQDGRYLAALLHSQGYEVFGLVHGQDPGRAERLVEEYPFITPITGDLLDLHSLIAALELSQPAEVYNLAGISFVPLSFSQSELVSNVVGMGALRLLEAITVFTRGGATTRFYQASSSEMFGRPTSSPQDETTPLRPLSPYGVAKVFAHNMTAAFRVSQGLFAVSGIAYNHESPARGLEFVTRKVTNAVAKIKLGLKNELTIGNLDAQRDWGYAADYVKAMWLMMQQDEPDDYVIATGTLHSVRDLVRTAFAAAGIEDWEHHVRIDERFLRPAEVGQLVGNASKARAELGWQPSISFEELIAMMVEHDLKIESERSDERSR